MDPPASCDRLLPSKQKKMHGWKLFITPQKVEKEHYLDQTLFFLASSNLSFFSFHFSREGGGQNFGQFFWPNDPGVEFLVILVSFVTLLRCFGSFLNSGRGDGGCFNGKTLIRKREPNKRTEVLPSIFFL